MDFINVVVTAVIGALTGAGAALLKNRIDYQHEVRSELWNKRYESYKRIWKLTQLLPRWPKNETLTYKGLFTLSTQCQNWYFEDGGILLSESGRKKYGTMQETITNIRMKKQADGTDSLLDGSDYTIVMEACSAFRTAMTSELLSRRMNQ